jgi:hypothetical protein
LLQHQTLLIQHLIQVDQLAEVAKAVRAAITAAHVVIVVTELLKKRSLLTQSALSSLTA